jgi:hypothetical protein
MTNDKDSAVPIMQIQSPETFKELFIINTDGTVTGDIENASEAAKVFFESFRDLIQRNIHQPTQSNNVNIRELRRLASILKQWRSTLMLNKMDGQQWRSLNKAFDDLEALAAQPTQSDATAKAGNIVQKYMRSELERPAQSDAQLIANERKAIAAWLRGEVDTDYTDPEYDIGRNLADAIERGAYIQEQSK